ncbi:hypothetical protein D3C71_1883220 [compost metagenome]
MIPITIVDIACGIKKTERNVFRENIFLLSIIANDKPMTASNTDVKKANTTVFVMGLTYLND